MAQSFTISGYAFDPRTTWGTGVDSVQAIAYRRPGSGKPSISLGAATYGDTRTDLSAIYGSQALMSGYHLASTTLTPDPYLFVVGSHNVTDNSWSARTTSAYVNIPTDTLTITRDGTGTGGISASGLSCAGGSGTQALPCGASYALGTVVTLTAAPDSGSTFGGWGGACAAQGTNTSCAVTLAGASFVTASFAATPSSVTTEYYHTDVVGSVRAITDQTGATVIRHDYQPFGEDTHPLTGDPMRFAGKELDPESALMNFDARYYRNTWGRFTQVDPAGGSFGDTQSWNRYAYGRNNPLRFIDPTGMETTCNTKTVTSDTVCSGYDETVNVSATGDVVQLMRRISSGVGAGGAAGGQSANDATVVDEHNGFCEGLTNGIIYTTWRCDAPTTGIGGPALETFQTPSSTSAAAPAASPAPVVAALEVVADLAAPEVVVAVAITYEVIAHQAQILKSLDDLAQWTAQVLQARGKGERNWAAKQDGTANRYKGWRIDPNDPNKITRQDPQTGKDVSKNKPVDWDEWQRNR